MNQMQRKPVFAWAWLCDFGLCCWAEPDRKCLIANGKPSSEAKPVRVRLVRLTNRRKRSKGRTANG